MPPDAKSLILSIHDVGPRFEHQVDILHERLARVAGPSKVAMLVVPDHWGEAPIMAGTAFAARLRRWAASGGEIFLHGWFHRDLADHRGRMTRFRARHMTAGEGEFLGLDRDEAARRMRDGRALLEDVTGRPLAGFVAPAWLYGPGALEALSGEGFAIAEDHMKVWHPPSGRILSRGPVVTWASRSPARIASSLFFAALARRALAGLPVLRLAVHPGDTGVPALMKSIDATLDALARDRQVIRYADLLDGLKASLCSCEGRSTGPQALSPAILGPCLRRSAGAQRQQSNFLQSSRGTSGTLCVS